jgi:hypothetical protein
MKIEEKNLLLGNENYLSYTITPPSYIGGYRLGGNNGLQINLTTKPNWFHRKMMKLCLGWEWIDNK